VAGISALAQQQVQRVSDPPDACRVTAIGRQHRVGHRGRRRRRRYRRGGRRGRLLLFLVQHVLAYLILDQRRDAHAAVADRQVA